MAAFRIVAWINRLLFSIRSTKRIVYLKSWKDVREGLFVITEVSYGPIGVTHFYNRDDKRYTFTRPPLSYEYPLVELARRMSSNPGKVVKIWNSAR